MDYTKIRNLKTKFGNENYKQNVEINDNEIKFYSYSHLIAIYNKENKQLTLTKKWDYSNTTITYLKQFINNYTLLEYKNKKQFEKLIETNKINVLN